MQRNQNRVKQNEKTEEYVPNERKDSISGKKKKLNKTEITNLIELKVMVIKMLTKFKKRMVEHRMSTKIENTRRRSQS